MNPNGIGDRLLQWLTLRGPRSLGPVWRYGLAVVIAVVAAVLGRQLSPGLGATCSYNLTLVGVVVATALPAALKGTHGALTHVWNMLAAEQVLDDKCRDEGFPPFSDCQRPPAKPEACKL